MQLTPAQTKTIGGIIRSVARSQSQRFFKPEINTVDRSSFVYLAIEAQIRVALRDAGFSFEMIIGQIDLMDPIITQMKQDGYVVEEELINDTLSA